MSSDLLAEFDSFYRAPHGAKSNPTTTSNDLSFLSGNAGSGQPTQQSGQQQPEYSQWQGTQKPNDNIWGSMNAFQPAANTQPSATPQNDIWGSLETLQQKSQPPAQGLNSSSAGKGGFALNNSRINNPPRNTGTVQGQTQNLFSGFAPIAQPASEFGTGSGQFSFPKQHTPMGVPSGDVLFDAVEEQSAPVDDDDEFGDFESVTPEPSFQSAPPPPPPTQSLGLFGAESHRPQPTQKQTSASFAPANYDHGILSFAPVQKSASFEQRSPFESASSTQPPTQTKQDTKKKLPSSVAVWSDLEPKVSKSNSSQALSIPTEQADDEWGDFSPETPAVTSAKGVSGNTLDSWAWDSAGSPAVTSPQVNIPPPTNIPPPSVFLTLFPTLFNLPQSKLFAPVSGQTFSLKNRILSDPSTIQFLRGYLLIATVAGRVLAGRKLRWKRDTILAQSMRVGPSAAGGKGGMKLAGLDRAEITREDRDAAEVARIWKEQLGRLRSAVAVSNSNTQDSSHQLAIPDVSENIHIKTQPGAVTAPKPCIICGLKRDERANKVDVDVEDSFGEWWIDHWGHRSCRNFWLEHESKLRSR